MDRRNGNHTVLRYRYFTEAGDMREWLKKIWCPQDTCGALIIVTGLYFTFYNFADILLMQYNPVEWYENVVRNRENPLFAIECLLLIAFLNTAWRCFRELLSEKFSASSIMNRKYYLLPLVAGPPVLWLGIRFSAAAKILPDIPLFLMFYCFAAVLMPAAWKTSRKAFAVGFIPPLIYGALICRTPLPVSIQYVFILACYLGIVYLLCLLFNRRFPGIARRNFLTLTAIGILSIAYPYFSEYHFRKQFDHVCDALATLYGEKADPGMLERLYYHGTVPNMPEKLPDFSGDFADGSDLYRLLDKKIRDFTAADRNSLEQWERDRKTMFAELDALVRLPYLKEARDFAKPLHEFGTSNMILMQSWWNTYRLRCRLAVLRGEKSVALESLGKMERLEQFLYDDVTLVSMLLGTDAQIARLSVLGDILDAGLLDGTELEKLQYSLADGDRQIPQFAANALFYEGVLLIQMFKRNSGKMDSRDRKVPVMQLLIQDQTHVLACLYNVAKLLPKDYFEIENSVNQVLDALAKRSYSFHRNFLIDLKSCLRKFAYLSLKQRETILAVAEERARLEGKPVAYYLKNAPLDPFTGRALSTEVPAEKQDAELP